MKYETKDLRIKATTDFWKSVSGEMQKRQIRKRNQWFLAIAVDAIKSAIPCQQNSQQKSALF